MEAAQANNIDNFSAWFGEVLNSLCIDRMDGNEEIFARVTVFDEPNKFS